MKNPLDPTIKENWQYHDEYEFWYMPYPGTNAVQAEEGVRWRGFKPWENAKLPERESVTLSEPMEQIRRSAQAIYDASLDVSKWPELPPLVGILAGHILEQEKKINQIEVEPTEGK